MLDARYARYARYARVKKGLKSLVEDSIKNLIGHFCLRDFRKYFWEEISKSSLRKQYEKESM